MSFVNGFVLGLMALSLPVISFADSSADPCAKIAGKIYAPSVDALACQKSFPFNETLRQNVLTNIARVFDFFTFEDFYLDSPPPFEESTVDIRAAIAKINSSAYAVGEFFSFLSRPCADICEIDRF